MNRFAEFFDKWGLTIFLCLIGITVLFSLGCSIYTAVTNPFVGITGIVGNIASLGMLALWVYLEIISQEE